MEHKFVPSINEPLQEASEDPRNPDADSTAAMSAAFLWQGEPQYSQSLRSLGPGVVTLAETEASGKPGRYRSNSHASSINSVNSVHLAERNARLDDAPLNVRSRAGSASRLSPNDGSYSPGGGSFAADWTQGQGTGFQNQQFPERVRDFSDAGSLRGVRSFAPLSQAPSYTSSALSASASAAEWKERIDRLSQDRKVQSLKFNETLHGDGATRSVEVTFFPEAPSAPGTAAPSLPMVPVPYGGYPFPYPGMMYRPAMAPYGGAQGVDPHGGTENRTPAGEGDRHPSSFGDQGRPTTSPHPQRLNPLAGSFISEAGQADRDLSVVTAEEGDDKKGVFKEGSHIGETDLPDDRGSAYAPSAINDTLGTAASSDAKVSPSRIPKHSSRASIGRQQLPAAPYDDASGATKRDLTATRGTYKASQGRGKVGSNDDEFSEEYAGRGRGNSERGRGKFERGRGQPNRGRGRYLGKHFNPNYHSQLGEDN